MSESDAIQAGDCVSRRATAPTRPEPSGGAALKWLANGNVLGWSVFWVFGFLAVTAPVAATGQMVGAAVASVLGLILGVTCYLRLMRGGT